MTLWIRNAFMLALLGASCLTSGCWWRKPKIAAAPPPVIVPQPAPAPPPEPEPLPLPPKVEAEAASVNTLPGPPVETEIEAPKPVEPPKPPRTASRTPAPAAPPPAPEPAPSAEVPALVPLMPQAEHDRYLREIGDFIRKAEDNLAWIGDRKLDERQRVEVLRARTFIRQALELKQTDLMTARSLAQRADVLAQGVVNTLR